MAILLLVLDADILTPSQLHDIQAIVPKMECLITTDRDEIVRHLSDIEIATGRFPRDLLAKAPKLRWFQQWGGAGTDWLMRYPGIVEKDFILTNAAGAHAVPITEHIFGMLLMLTRQLHCSLRRQDRHEWKGFAQHELLELAGKTMLIVGVGGIGQRTATIARAFDMRVIGIRRNPEKAVPGMEAMYSLDQLREVLPEADVIVVTAPLTHETQHMIGEAELRAMKPDAILVNIGRGGTIDESALICALGEYWIAGACLDVFETEPLPEDSPLWDMDNVILTPHYSGWNPNFERRAFDIFLKNLKLYVAGEPLFNVVDKQFGY
jgi:phosphoglycerate dehydrogenase-like enzyme